MSQSHASLAAPGRRADREAALILPTEDENPARAFANAIMLALPLWALIGLAVAAVL